MKRTFDAVAAAFGLLLAAPVIVVLALMIRRDTPGPAIFSQQRVGREGRLFACHKLRTMTHGAPSVPTHEAPAAMVTPLGRTLRRYKLDELPQLWNVLKGEMSFVGPRPCLPAQDTLVSARRRLGVLAIRPGITGLAQIEGLDMSEPERLARRDADYIRDRSFAMDMRILLVTVLGGAGRGDRVRS